MRALAVVVGALGVLAGTIPAARASGPDVPVIRLAALDGALVDPFLLPRPARAVAFVFLSVECPVSSRYAPELRRLRDRHGDDGVIFTFVYPNPADSPQAIRAHMDEYGYPGQALRDPAHVLVRLAGVTVAPEAAVFDRAARRVYRGRIDDRYTALGVSRPVPVQRDLDDALAAVVAGRPAPQPGGPAVGCFIADWVG